MAESQKNIPAKRVDIESVKLVKEKTMMYKNRRVRSPQDAYELKKEFLGEVDREHFVVLCMDTKNQSTNIQKVHIGSLTQILYTREKC
ncbi:RadC-like JAB domain-containing protein [Ureibacillus acetophenoni]|uniref:RadC-like JAB domain-containing protein n=1 Tax=Ureibacillus acetophenoni TaxID=614649 RepID=A0A285TZB8_9BACL|nr:RadC-like JAB domain-containing protein [Ureibacillus acetophenoni]